MMIDMNMIILDLMCHAIEYDSIGYIVLLIDWDKYFGHIFSGSILFLVFLLFLYMMPEPRPKDPRRGRMRKLKKWW